MHPIIKIIKWRFYNFIREFGVDIKTFNFKAYDNYQQDYNHRLKNWNILKQKLIIRGYATEKHNARSCYFIIKNIIWKNIINYKINTYHYLHIPYNSYYFENFACENPFFNKRTIVNKYPDIGSIIINDNLKKIQSVLNNYLLLVEQIIIKYLITDLYDIAKIYMFDAIFII